MITTYVDFRYFARSATTHLLCYVLPTPSTPLSRQQRRSVRDAEIRTYYQAEWAKKIRHECIMADLVTRYHMSLSTLERIVWGRGRYKVAATA